MWRRHGKSARRRPARASLGLQRRDLVVLLDKMRDRLSRTQRQVADYVLRNYREVGFMGVAELSREAGVSPASVVRFASTLGFRGYPGLQRITQAIIRSELRQGERFAAAFDDVSREPLWHRVVAQESRNVAALLMSLDPQQLAKAVRLLVGARVVAIVGFRASATLAHYLSYNLRKVHDGVRLLASPGSVTLEELMLAGHSGVVAVFITFPRYSNELLKMAAFARRSRIPSIGVTNSRVSPLVSLCDVTLCAEVAEVSFTDFYAGPLALLNALIAEVAARRPQRALARLNALDDLAAEQGYLFLRSRIADGTGRGNPISGRRWRRSSLRQSTRVAGLLRRMPV